MKTSPEWTVIVDGFPFSLSQPLGIPVEDTATRVTNRKIGQNVELDFTFSFFSMRYTSDFFESYHLRFGDITKD